MIDVRHTPQPSNPHVEVGGPIFGTVVGNIEWKIVPSQAHLIESIGCRGVKGRTDRRIHCALQPRSWLAIRPNRGLHVHSGDGVEEIAVNIVFAAPDNFDRLAKLFRKNGSFRHLIWFRLAPEATTQQRDMASHIFFLDAEHARDSLLYPLRILPPPPSHHPSLPILAYPDRPLHENL